jgi:hypothetical protein
MANTITGYSRHFKQIEALASGSITPGHLLERTSAAADTLKVHALAGGVAQRIFAIEDELQGNGIDDVYADGALVQARQYMPGDLVYALIANGENISKADKLVSDGNGALEKADTDSATMEQDTVAYAMEDNDMSGSSGVDSPRCLVEIR